MGSSSKGRSRHPIRGPGLVFVGQVGNLPHRPRSIFATTAAPGHTNPSPPRPADPVLGDPLQVHLAVALGGEVVLLDLTEVEALLDCLIKRRVASFQGFGMTVVFKDDDEYAQFEAAKPKAQQEEDGHSTSNKRVDGFKHPALYPYQNGKVLQFDGSLR